MSELQNIRRYYDKCTINCNIEFTDDNLSLILFYIKLCLRCSLQALKERYNFGRGKKDAPIMSKILYVPEIKDNNRNRISSITLYFIAEVSPEVREKIRSINSLDNCVKDLLNSKPAEEIMKNCGRGRR